MNERLQYKEILCAFATRHALLRVAESTMNLHLSDGWATVELPTLVDHELIVFK
jgi:hypothetical protein